MVLSVGVCETAIGLAVLVKYVRSYGNDLVSSSV